MSVPSSDTALPRWEDRALERSLSVARDKSSARARRLVDAARKRAAAGSVGFTIAEVATDAGVSVRSFYRHFGGRDELLLALIEEEARTGAEVLRSVLEATDDAVARVQRCIETLCELVTAGSGYAALLVREHLRLGEEQPDDLRVALGPLLDVIYTELQRAAAAGALRTIEPFDAATVLALVLTHVHTAALLTPPGQASSRRVWEFCYAALSPSEGTPDD